MGHSAHASRRDTERARQHWQAGVGHARSGAWGEAVRSHARAAALARRDPLYALNHARALQASDRIDEALEEAVRALGLDPHQTLARRIASE